MSAWHRLDGLVSGAQGALGLGFLARYLGTLRLGPTQTQRPMGTGFLCSDWCLIFVKVSLGLVSRCGTGPDSYSFIRYRTGFWDLAGYDPDGCRPVVDLGLGDHGYGFGHLAGIGGTHFTIPSGVRVPCGAVRVPNVLRGSS